MFGTGPYSMRIWLDPERLSSHGMTAGDVVQALRDQNVQVAAGQVGAPPSPGQASFQIAINTQGRLANEEQFGDIVIRAGDKGEITHLRDVARIELGSDSYALRSLLDNKPAIALPIFQRPGSNALQMADAVRATMETLKKDFPQGVQYSTVYDTTGFVHESINAVLHTLFEAIVLVVIVVVLFLQGWRASIIPLLAVPVSLVGTFAVPADAGLRPERPDPVRPGPRHRHRRRRRHRGGRERRAEHSPRPRTHGRHAPGDGARCRDRSSPPPWCSAPSSSPPPSSAA